MLITKAEFARRMNVTPSAVGVAVRAGRISTTAEGLIDAEPAAVEWALNRRRQRFGVPRAPMTAPDDDDVEAAQIGVWMRWWFGPHERLPIALENWAALFHGRITTDAVESLLSALRANLARLTSPIMDNNDEC